MSQNKVIITTGGSGYLGTQVTKQLTNAGYTVEDIGVDITNEEAVMARSVQIKETYKNIWGVVHMASSPLDRKFLLSLSLPEFKKQLEVQTTGTFLISRELCPILEEGGCFMATTSIAIDNKGNFNKSGSYVPAKEALRGILRVLHFELASRSIRVYAVAPAFMPDGLNNDMPPKVLELLANKSAKKDITNAGEVADYIQKAIEDGAGIMRGKSIVVPGGETSIL